MGYSGQSGGLQGFLFDGDTWATLQHPDIIDGLGATQAFKIDGDYSRAGFLYDGVTWMTLEYSGAAATSAYDIDGANIVGVYEPISGPRGSFLYDGTTWTPLAYPDAQETFANGISGDRVVGFNIDDNGFHGFIATISNATGDFNFDGDVDGHDFLLWQRGGSPDPLSAGELAIWQTSYGVVSLAANSVTVPEPATLTLLILAYAGGCAICRSARQVS